VVKALLASCPALHVLDFTEFGWYEWGFWLGILHSMKGIVQRDVDGAGRLTHVFVRRRRRMRIDQFGHPRIINHDYVANLQQVSLLHLVR
jgi:hypothetical protein